MKKLFLALPLLLALSACHKHNDEFEFSGIVVDYELCTSLQDLGYAVQITSSDTIGRTYLTQTGQHVPNVIVIYNSDRMLRNQDSISGRIYFDPGHSKGNCNYQYRETSGDIPEACFTQVKVLKKNT